MPAAHRIDIDGQTTPPGDPWCEDWETAARRQLLARLGRWAVALALLAGVAAALVWGTPGWPPGARLSLGLLAGACIAWGVLQLGHTPVALGVVLALSGLGLHSPQALVSNGGDGPLWLMLGAGVMASAVHHSGLLPRWVLRAAQGATSARMLLMRVLPVVAATAFLVPSASARALWLLPVFMALARALDDAALVRTLALLFPGVILLSSCASPLGAAAHVLALDLLRHAGAPAPSLLQWVLWATPLAGAACLLAAGLASRRLRRHPGRRPLRLPPADLAHFNPHQRAVAGVLALTWVGWLSTSLHGLPPAAVAALGALAITWRPLTGIDLRTALRLADWPHLMFLAMALMLGQALVGSGAPWLLASALGLNTGAGMPGLALLLAAAVLAAQGMRSQTASALLLLTLGLPWLLPAGAGSAPAAAAAVPALLCVMAAGWCLLAGRHWHPLHAYARAQAAVWPTWAAPSPGPSAEGQRLRNALLPGLAALLLVAGWLVHPA